MMDWLLLLLLILISHRTANYIYSQSIATILIKHRPSVCSSQWWLQNRTCKNTFFHLYGKSDKNLCQQRPEAHMYYIINMYVFGTVRSQHKWEQIFRWKIIFTRISRAKKKHPHTRQVSELNWKIRAQICLHMSTQHWTGRAIIER